MVYMIAQGRTEMIFLHGKRLGLRTSWDPYIRDVTCAGQRTSSSTVKRTTRQIFSGFVPCSIEPLQGAFSSPEWDIWAQDLGMLKKEIRSSCHWVVPYLS